MTETEVYQLLSLVRVTFPGSTFAKLAPYDLKATVRAWRLMLEDIPYAVAEKAVVIHASRCVFAPTIADIRSIALELTHPGGSLTGDELWGKTLELVHRCGRLKRDRVLGEIPEEARGFVRRWYLDICDSEAVGVTRAQFIRAWEAERERDRKRALMPARLKGPEGGAGPKALTEGAAALMSAGETDVRALAESAAALMTAERKSAPDGGGGGSVAAENTV